MMRFSREKFGKESLYRLLTEKGYTIDSFPDDFSVIPLAEEGQGALKTDAQIGIEWIRKSPTQTGGMIKYPEAVYYMELHPYHIDYETWVKKEVAKKLPCIK